MIFNVPPCSPPSTEGPVAALPARNVMPRGVTGLKGPVESATLLFSVSSAAPLNELRKISFPAHISMFPLVVVMSVRGFINDLTILTSRPALNNKLPPWLGVATVPVVVIAAFTLMSRPQHTTRLPLVAVIAALTFTSLSASKVRVVGVKPVLTQVIGSWTVISPNPFPVLVVVIVMSVPVAPVRAVLS